MYISEIFFFSYSSFNYWNNKSEKIKYYKKNLKKKRKRIIIFICPFEFRCSCVVHREREWTWGYKDSQRHCLLTCNLFLWLERSRLSWLVSWFRGELNDLMLVHACMAWGYESDHCISIIEIIVHFGRIITGDYLANHRIWYIYKSLLVILS